MADYNPDIDYEGPEPENEPVAQEEKEENFNAVFAKMEIPKAGTFYQMMMPCDVMHRIQWVHQEQGPGIMALWLQDMYIWLGFSHKAAKLFIREQGLDCFERLRVLTDKNVNDICNVARKPGCNNANSMPKEGRRSQ